jgi:hypothetical protein
LKENPALLNKNKEDSMKIGKNVGKNTREGDINSIQQRIETSLASHQITEGISQSQSIAHNNSSVLHNSKHGVIGRG